MRCAAAPGGSRSPRSGPRPGCPGEAVARRLHVPAPPAPRPTPRAPARHPPRDPARGARWGGVPAHPADPDDEAGTPGGPPSGAGDVRLRRISWCPREAWKRRERSHRPPARLPAAKRTRGLGAEGRGPPWNRVAQGRGGAHLRSALVCKQTALLISLAGARGRGRGLGGAQGRPRRGRSFARLRPRLPTSLHPPPHPSFVPTTSGGAQVPRLARLPGDLTPSLSLPICPVKTGMRFQQWAAKVKTRTLALFSVK